MIHKEKKELFAKVFDTVEGRKVIDWLCKQHYIHNSTWNKDNSNYETIFREGQRKVILGILKILESKEK